MTSKDIEVDFGEEDAARIVCESIMRAYAEYARLLLIAFLWLAMTLFCVWYVVKSYHEDGKAMTSDGASVERTTIDEGGIAE